MIDSTIQKMGNTSERKLTVKQRKAVAEYLKTGNKSAAIRAVYNTKEKHVHQHANMFFKRPKIVDALEKALKEQKFDDAYAVETLKKIVNGGMQNIDIARPDTSLKALETFWKITNKIGGGNKEPLRADPESVAKKMDMTELQKALKEMDKKQKRILSIIGGIRTKEEEGEIVE